MSVIARKIYSFQAETSRRLNTYINGLCEKHFSNVMNLANPVLGRNLYVTELFKRSLMDEKPSGDWIFRYIKSLPIYYARNAVEWTRYVFVFMLCRNFHQNKRKDEALSADCFIDTFLVTDKVVANGQWRDEHFLNLCDVLQARGLRVTLLPSFVGWHQWRRFAKVFSALYGNSHTVIHEFDLLGWLDMLKCLLYILSYPIYLFRLMMGLSGSNLDQLAREEMAGSLVYAGFHGYSKYLLGCRLAAKAVHAKKLISWYESQDRDRHLYKGLRDTGWKARIYGCRFFVYSPAQYSFVPLPGEDMHGLVPDRILVNGPKFMDLYEAPFRSRCALGPALRYQYLLEAPSQPVGEGILILLSCLESDTRSILSVCRTSMLKDKNVKVKFHPNTKISDQREMAKSFPRGWELSMEKLPQLFTQCSLIVSSESGSALEAACCGLAVIIVANQESFTSNPMPGQYQGILWDMVYDAAEMESVCKKLSDFRNGRKEEVLKWIELCRLEYFTKLDEAMVEQAFEL